MDVNKILDDLRSQRDQLDEAILALQRLSTTTGKRRGRPPACLKEMQDIKEPAAPVAKRRGRPPKNAK